MNDDFLHKLRIDPPTAFAMRLKARLDRAANPRARFARWGLLALLCGTAFALVSPGVRHSILQWFAPSQPNAAVAQSPRAQALRDQGPGSAPPTPALPPSADASTHTRRGGPASGNHPSGEQLPAPPLAQMQASQAVPEGATGDAPAVEAPPPPFIISLPAAASTAGSTPEQLAIQATATRRGMFKVMGWAMTPVRALLLSKAPYDTQKLETAAVRTEELAGLIGPVIQADTRPFPVDTTALDKIWTDMADFDFKADELASAARALAMAAQAGDRIAVMQASSRVGMACGACHDAYRRKPTDSTR